MGIDSIGAISSTPLTSSNNSASQSIDRQIQALRQQIQQYSQEQQRAEQKKDQDAVKEWKKKIQELEEKIQELEQQKTGSTNENAPPQQELEAEALAPPPTDYAIDVMA